MKARGIYVAIELQSKRQFRSEDGVAVPGLLPPGGGPAAHFDPTMSKLDVGVGPGFTGSRQSGNRSGPS